MPIPDKEYEALSKINKTFSNKLKLSSKNQDQDDVYKVDNEQNLGSQSESDDSSDGIKVTNHQAEGRSRK